MRVAGLFFLSFLFVLLSSTSHAKAGFKNGNDIGVVYLSGSVTYLCNTYNGAPITEHHDCLGSVTTPGTHDYFTTDSKVQGDKVTLTATHQDGSKRTKDNDFDSNKSVSSKRFNLTVTSLFQRPLLKEGTNNISYQITKGKDVVEEGSFVSTVKDMGDRVCEKRVITVYDENYCHNMAYGCDHYFNLENNCQY